MSEYTLHHGDCLDILPTLEAGSVDLTVTSPPYDNLRDYGKDFDAQTFQWKPIIKELYRVTAVGGVVVWVVADATIKGSRTGTGFRQALWAMECGFRLHQHLIYEKSGGPPPDKTRYEETTENMFVFSKGKPKTINLIRDKKNKWAGDTGFGQKTIREKDNTLGKRSRKPIRDYGKRTSIWRYSVGFGYSSKDKSAYQHPAIFPDKLAHDHIISWSNEGDKVLDNFMGSGTTGVAAMKTKRNFIGIELDADYFKLAETRIKNANNEFTPTAKEKASGQMSIFGGDDA